MQTWSGPSNKHRLYLLESHEVNIGLKDQFELLKFLAVWMKEDENDPNP